LGRGSLSRVCWVVVLGRLLGSFQHEELMLWCTCAMDVTRRGMERIGRLWVGIVDIGECMEGVKGNTDYLVLSFGLVWR
jgi:hypothetical protein